MKYELEANRQADRDFATAVDKELSKIARKDAEMPKKRNLIFKKIHCIEEGLLAESTRIASGTYGTADVSALKGRLAVVQDDIKNLEYLSDQYKQISRSYPIEYTRNIRFARTIKNYFEKRLEGGI